MTHRLRWDLPVEPDDVAAGRLKWVPGGARAAGATADALVALHAIESERRQRVALGALMSLALLDELMSLPTGTPVSRTALSAAARDRLARAPDGVVEIDGDDVVRLATPPLTVVAVVVRGTAWRAALQRAGTFTPFAQRVLLLDRLRPPHASLAWEAPASGVGIWLGRRPAEAAVEAAPEVFTQRYLTPAGWRFAERAWGAYCDPARTLKADVPESAGAIRSGRGGRDFEGSDQPSTPRLW